MITSQQPLSGDSRPSIRDAPGAISPAVVGPWLAAAIAFGWAVAVSATGGFVVQIASIRISSHRIVPAYLLGVILLLPTRKSRAMLQRWCGISIAARTLTAVALAVSALTLIAGLVFGTFTAVGDPFGYIAQADLWLKRELFQSQGPVLAMLWTDAASAFCPLGFRAAAISGTMVPTYAPGLPLLMAAMKATFGENGVYLVVPLCGAAAVYLTYRLGRLWRDCGTGLVAAALLASSPVFLFQLVQPMSDVPVTACWLLAIVAACDGTWKGALGAGLAASIAIIIRPNLAPLAAPLAAWMFVWPATPGLRGRATRVLLLACGLAPLTILVAWVQSTLYGSPFASGYGRAADIYSLANLLPNVSRYPRWLLQTHTPFVFLGLLAPFLNQSAGGGPRLRVGGARTFAWLALAFAASVFLCYALYIPFDHWTFLRFVLPALPLVVTLAAGALDSLLGRWQAWRRTAMALATVLFILLYVQAAVRGDAFALRDAYRAQYRDVARFLRDHSPRNAAFIGLVQTSNVSYYARRQTIRYDLIAPRDFDRALADLRRVGYKPYLLLATGEEADFRGRFSGKSRIGELRCAPRSRFGQGGVVQLYNLNDCVPK